MDSETNETYPPAGATNTEQQPIPYERFQGVIGQKNAALAEVETLKVQMADLQSTQATQRDTELEAQNKWQELAESRAAELEAANVTVSEVESLKATLQQTLDTALAAIPEKMRTLVPSELTIQQQLAYINTNAAMLKMPVAPDLNGGAGGNSRPGQNSKPLTAQELAVAKAAGMTPDEYAKIQNDRDAASGAQNDTMNALAETGLLSN